MSEDCSICCSPLGTEPIGACVPCGHVVHVECFEEWAQHKKSSQRHVKCPICNGSSLQFVKIFLDLSAAAAQTNSAALEDDTISLDEEEEMEKLSEQEAKQKRQEEEQSATAGDESEENSNHNNNNDEQEVTRQDISGAEVDGETNGLDSLAEMFDFEEEDGINPEQVNNNNNQQRAIGNAPAQNGVEVIVLDDDDEVDDVLPIVARSYNNEIIILDDSVDDSTEVHALSKRQPENSLESEGMKQKVKKYKRLAITYRTRFETLESEREENVQRYQELQKEVAKLHKQLGDNAMSLKTVELKLQRKDREMEGLRLECQERRRENEQAKTAMTKSEQTLRALQLSLQQQKTELVAKYDKACATSLKEFEYILKKENPRLKQENEQLKHQLRQLQQHHDHHQQQPSNNNSTKRPAIEFNSELNPYKKPSAGKKQLMQELGHMSSVVERDTPRGFQSACRTHPMMPSTTTPLAASSTASYRSSELPISGTMAAAVTGTNSESSLQLTTTKKMSAQAVRMGLAAAARRTSSSSKTNNNHILQNPYSALARK